MIGFSLHASCKNTVFASSPFETGPSRTGNIGRGSPYSHAVVLGSPEICGFSATTDDIVSALRRGEASPSVDRAYYLKEIVYRSGTAEESHLIPSERRKFICTFL
jgi:hypothetical protein